MISTEDVKKLRDQSGISVMQCRKALEEAGGNFDKAVVILQKRGAEVAAKKADRALGAGVVVLRTKQKAPSTQTPWPSPRVNPTNAFMWMT